jgi:hypothetical protein
MPFDPCPFRAAQVTSPNGPLQPLRAFLCSTQLALCVSLLSIIRLFEGGVLLTLIFCDPNAVAMRGVRG